MLDRYLDFGRVGAKRLAELVFWIGITLSTISSILVGKYLYMTYMYDKEFVYMQDGQQWFSSKQVNNLPLGIGGAVVSFLVSLVIIKVACEVLYLIIRCMETYLEKNKESAE
jgi:hypothetical protein